MEPPRVRELGAGRALLDLGFRDTEGLVAAYLLPEESGWDLVETGPTSCRERILQGIAAAGVDRDEVRKVFVTHIHLDHAGGAGALAELLPNAMFYAHREGVPHLIDPARLAESTRRAWGVAADFLWGPIERLSPQRVVALQGGERFPLRGGELRCIEAPGHAKHHVAFFDSWLGALLAGDAAGVRLEGSVRARPAIPPPDLDLDQLFATLDQLRRAQPRALWYSHFGPRGDPELALEEYRRSVESWRNAGYAAMQEEASVSHVAQALKDWDHAESLRRSEPPPEDDRVSLISGYEMAAQGLLRYFRTHASPPGGPA